MDIKELEYYTIGDSFGGNQDWMHDWWMRIGGCAALTAVDSLICIERTFGIEGLCAVDPWSLTKDTYRDFGMIMKPYISPRFRGVDKLSIFVKGLGKYLAERSVKSILMEELSMSEDYSTACEALTSQLDMNIPVPFLNLRHQDKEFKEFIWHWFILSGYKWEDGELYVKFTTYGGYEWHSFRKLWNSGCDEKGGMIIINSDEFVKIHKSIQINC